MSWGSKQKKERIFCNVYLSERIFFNICILSEFIVYWKKTFGMYIYIYSFAYKKTFLLGLKSLKAFFVSLISTFRQAGIWSNAYKMVRD